MRLYGHVLQARPALGGRGVQAFATGRPRGPRTTVCP